MGARPGQSLRSSASSESSCTRAPWQEGGGRMQQPVVSHRCRSCWSLFVPSPEKGREEKSQALYSEPHQMFPYLFQGGGGVLIPQMREPRPRGAKSP